MNKQPQQVNIASRIIWLLLLVLSLSTIFNTTAIIGLICYLAGAK